MNLRNAFAIATWSWFVTGAVVAVAELAVAVVGESRGVAAADSLRTLLLWPGVPFALLIASDRSQVSDLVRVCAVLVTWAAAGGAVVVIRRFAKIHFKSLDSSRKSLFVHEAIVVVGLLGWIWVAGVQRQYFVPADSLISYVVGSSSVSGAVLDCLVLFAEAIVILGVCGVVTRALTKRRDVTASSTDGSGT